MLTQSPPPGENEKDVMIKKKSANIGIGNFGEKKRVKRRGVYKVWTVVKNWGIGVTLVDGGGARKLRMLLLFDKVVKFVIEQGDL